MDAPDLREMVARAINGADNEWADAPRTMPHEAWPQHVADAVMAVPAIADALRDAEALAKVREQFSDTDAHSAVVLQRIANITAGDHPEAFIAMDESARQQVRNLVGEWFDDFNLADDFLGMLHRSGFQITRIADQLREEA